MKNDSGMASYPQLLHNAFLGIELGSTRIKSVLIDGDHRILATGNHDWENRLEDGIWTYSLEDVWIGLRSSFSSLAAQVLERYGIKLKTVGRICISAMMHGYLPFSNENGLLVPFRTWRNTNTADASMKLSESLGFNIPLRWSAAHYYQALMNGEDHCSKVSFITTLSGYVHWKLTGLQVIGVGDASGMFPAGLDGFDIGMLDEFNRLCSEFGSEAPITMPKVLFAGDDAGSLTVEGALLLDPSGNLCSGIPFCPPEGDAGTGMVATNSITERTGNVSAGTSVFAMIVLDRKLQGAYPEIDIVATPDGKPVAMVHCNNCTSDIDAWVKLLVDFMETAGVASAISNVYDLLYASALKGDPNCGGLLSYNYLSGEPITKFDEGRPMLARLPDSKFNFPNLSRSLLFSAIATLRIGMDILVTEEGVNTELLYGHGGYFKVSAAGQNLMAAALNLPIIVYESAGEGGAWGAALLAAYASQKSKDESLSEYLSNRVFSEMKSISAIPDANDVAGFNEYLKAYIRGLEIEREAVKSF